MQIDYQSTVAIYMQIINEIERLIADGDLKPGDSLPAIRNLANQLDISTSTIARAYQDLEHNGVIETGGRRGTFVKKSIKEIPCKDSIKSFKVIIRDLIKNGATAEQIRGQFELALNEIFK